MSRAVEFVEAVRKDMTARGFIELAWHPNIVTDGIGLLFTDKAQSAPLEPFHAIPVVASGLALMKCETPEKLARNLCILAAGAYREMMDRQADDRMAYAARVAEHP